MGCWNGTCLVSNLPIGGGDPVVAFLVSQETNKNASQVYGNFCPTDLVFPISLPIEAVYDDYGSISNFVEDDLCSKHVMKVFELPLSRVLDTISHTEKIYLGDDPVGLVMFHKHLYDICINNISSEYHNSLKTIYRNGISKKLNYLTKTDIVSKLDNELIMYDLIKDFSMDNARKDKSTIISFIELVSEEINSFPHLKEQIIEEFSSKMASRGAINVALQRLRKTWISGSGKGSQSTNLRAHILLANAIKEVALKDLDPNYIYHEFLGKDY